MNQTSIPQQKPVLSRRPFLKKIGATAAFIAASAGGIASSQASGLRGPRRYRQSFLDRQRVYRALQSRRWKAYLVRQRAASTEYQSGITLPTPNTDESNYPNYIGSFSKTLPHNNLGEVDASAYQALKHALQTGNSNDFNQIPLDANAARKLANPQAAFAYILTGGDSHNFGFPAAPAFESAWNASEMGEVYLHALLRDVAFDQFASSQAASRAVDQMNAFSDFRGPKVGGQVTAQTLFRGEAAGDLIGNYISQFLLLPITESGVAREQRYPAPIQGMDHMTNYADWLNILRGGAPTTSTTFENTNRYIATGRDLAEFVHTDFSYQAYLQAALILFGLGAPVNPGNPYLNINNQGAFVTFGGAEILTTIANVALLGLKAAWYQKWNVHRRLRPEVFSGRIDNYKREAANYQIHDDILNSTILNDVFDQTGNYLLPMAYPEGSPTHPAYPAGHAVIAGACCTVLKAFFDGSASISNPVEVDPGSNSTALRAFSGNETLTVGNELDKLANNISLGRDIAGVHWRTDGTEGVKLGEQVAIRYLKDQKTTYNEGGSNISFVGFSGNTVTI